MSQNFRNPVGNKLLAAVPREEYERLLPHLELVSLSLKQVLYERNEPIKFVYFPVQGAISLLTLMENDQALEVATVGNEGMVGISLLLRTTQSPIQAIAQIPGDALRMKAEVFQSEVYKGSLLHTLLLRYTQTLINQVSQTSACNRLHPVEQRCSRWLLMTRDRVESNEFLLTQEFLSMMLGEGSASAIVVAATLQEAGLITYHHGEIKILDNFGLEASSCECYRVNKQEFERLIPTTFTP